LYLITTIPLPPAPPIGASFAPAPPPVLVVPSSPVLPQPPPPKPPVPGPGSEDLPPPPPEKYLPLGPVSPKDVASGPKKPVGVKLPSPPGLQGVPLAPAPPPPPPKPGLVLPPEFP